MLTSRIKKNKKTKKNKTKNKKTLMFLFIFPFWLKKSHSGFIGANWGNLGVTELGGGISVLGALLTEFVSEESVYLCVYVCMCSVDEI